MAEAALISGVRSTLARYAGPKAADRVPISPHIVYPTPGMRKKP